MFLHHLQYKELHRGLVTLTLFYDIREPVVQENTSEYCVFVEAYSQSKKRYRKIITF